MKFRLLLVRMLFSLVAINGQLTKAKSDGESGCGTEVIKNKTFN
jgi:hypothetical protein